MLLDNQECNHFKQKKLFKKKLQNRITCTVYCVLSTVLICFLQSLRLSLGFLKILKITGSAITAFSTFVTVSTVHICTV